MEHGRALSVRHVTLDLRVESSSPNLGVEPTLKNKKKKILKVCPISNIELKCGFLKI